MWNNYPDDSGEKFIPAGIPAVSLFGGGGREYGYSVNLPQFNIVHKKGLVADLYDDGFDESFQFMWLPLPENIFANGRTKVYCRIRLRVNAENNRDSITTIPDDDDEFYVDNIELKKYSPDDFADSISIQPVRMKKAIANTIMPIEQAANIPIEVEVQNETPYKVNSYNVEVKIKSQKREGWPGSYEDPFKNDNFIRTIIDFKGLQPFEKKVIQFTDFTPIADIDTSGIKNFIDKPLKGYNRYESRIDIFGVNKQKLTKHDDNLFDFSLYLSDVFAYDRQQNPRNDIPEFTNIDWSCLSMPAYSSGDYTVNTMAGDYGGSAPGRLAMKFTLSRDDTLYGYQGHYNSTALDDIKYELYTSINDSLPGELIEESKHKSWVMWDDIRDAVFNDEYVVSLLKKPLYLKKGTYWMSVSQMGESSFWLGASKYRMGMRTMSVSDNKETAAGNLSLMINRQFRKPDTKGNINVFAYCNSLSGNDWVPFMPNSGFPAYAHLDYLGTSPRDKSTKTYTRGTWVPMLRPYFGTSHITGVEPEETISGELIVYPNPASDYIEISVSSVILSETKDPFIKIYNVLGVEITTPNLTSALPQGEGVVRLDVSGLSPGVYFVRIGDRVQKFVKY
jgi:hypothetical protein